MDKIKMELFRTEEQDLKIFFMIGRKELPPQEKVIAILAYKLEEAVETAKKDYAGFLIFYTGQSIPVQELLNKLKSDQSISLSANQKEQLISPKELNFEQFKNSLLLVSDKYVNRKDSKTLKGIIQKLETNKRK